MRSLIFSVAGICLALWSLYLLVEYFPFLLGLHVPAQGEGDADANFKKIMFVFGPIATLLGGTSGYLISRLGKN
jgi:hypothetical protein